MNNLLLFYFGFSLGGNFNNFEMKQRKILLNQRLKIVAINLRRNLPFMYEHFRNNRETRV